MTPDEPGPSLYERLREIREDLALAVAAEQTSSELLERAAALLRGASARKAEAEKHIAEILRAAEAVEFPPARPSRRPRLEEGSPSDRARAEKVLAALLRDPAQSNHRVASLTGVHHSVVARIRRDHFGGKSRGKSSDAQILGGNPFPPELLP